MDQPHSKLCQIYNHAQERIIRACNLGEITREQTLTVLLTGPANLIAYFFDPSEWKQCCDRLLEITEDTCRKISETNADDE